MATILYQVSLQQAIASTRLQLCTVAIKSFMESYAILYCFTLGKPVDLKGHVDYVPTVFVYTKNVDMLKQVQKEERERRLVIVKGIPLLQ